MPRFLGPGLVAVLAVTAFIASASPALGAHVECGDVITQDTRLDSDLIDCPADGLVIGASDITLDLNRHTVDGDGVSCGAGIANGSAGPQRVRCVSPSEPGHDRVVVRNGTVRDFYVGVELEHASDNALRRLRILNHREPGILLHESSGTVIEGNIITSFAGGHLATGVFLSDGTVVKRNVITANGGHGIDQGDSKLSRIEKNVVSRNNGDGISGLGFDQMIVKHNLVTGNRGDGIGVEDSAAENLIEDNWIGDNGNLGLMMGEGADRNHVVGNSVLRNAGGGIEVWQGDQSVIEHNYVSANGGRGGIVLSFSDSENILRANRVTGNSGSGIVLGSVAGNLIEANYVTRNGEDGIQVENELSALPVANVVRRNFARDNVDDGIDTESALTSIGSNVANRNGDLGIEAVSGVTDAGGNRAARNGNPLQCVNVFCR